MSFIIKSNGNNKNSIILNSRTFPVKNRSVKNIKKIQSISSVSQSKYLRSLEMFYYKTLS